MMMMFRCLPAIFFTVGIFADGKSSENSYVDELHGKSRLLNGECDNINDGDVSITVRAFGNEVTLDPDSGDILDGENRIDLFRVDVLESILSTFIGADEIYKEQVCVAVGTYTFEITDGFGNGLDNNDDQEGSYEISLDNVIIKAGSQFNFSESVTFMYEGPSSAPSVSDKPSTSIFPSVPPTVERSMKPSMIAADSFEWYITQLSNGTMIGESSMVMAYNISNRYYRLDVLENDCVTVVDGALDVFETVTSLGNGFMNVTASLAIDQEDIESNNGIWSPGIDGGKINFCVAMSVYLQDNNGDVIMNFLETKYEIIVDKTTDFSLAEIVTERAGPQDGGKEEIDYEESLNVFQCHEDYSAVSPIKALSQGDILQICVNVEDSNSAFEIDYVKEMNITQAGSTVLVIANRTDYDYGDLTFTQCDGGENQICRVKFQLLGTFFADNEPSNLNISGVGKLTLKNMRRLQLDHSMNIPFLSNGNTRKLKGNDDGNPFTLDVELAKNYESEAVGITMFGVISTMLAVICAAYVV